MVLPPFPVFFRLDIEHERFKVGVFHQALKAEAERIGVNSRELTHTNADLADVQSGTAIGFGPDTVQDGRSDPQFVHKTRIAY